MWSTRIIEFNLVNKIKFYVSNFLPYLREIVVVSSFAANKTALNVMHWLTINDVCFMMKKAKFVQVARESQTFGVKQSSLFKTIIAIVNFFILLLVLIGPLVPFSDFLHGSLVHEITNTEITIGVTSNSGIDLGLLFKSELTLASEKLERNAEKWKFLYNTRFYKSGDPNTIRLITMSSYSQTFHDFMLDDDNKDKSLDSFLDGGSIHINIGFTVNTLSNPI